MFRSKPIIIFRSLQNFKKQGKILLFVRFITYYKIYVTIESWFSIVPYVDITVYMR